MRWGYLEEMVHPLQLCVHRPTSSDLWHPHLQQKMSINSVVPCSCGKCFRLTIYRSLVPLVPNVLGYWPKDSNKMVTAGINGSLYIYMTDVTRELSVYRLGSHPGPTFVNFIFLVTITTNCLASVFSHVWTSLPVQIKSSHYNHLHFNFNLTPAGQCTAHTKIKVIRKQINKLLKEKLQKGSS